MAGIIITNAPGYYRLMVKRRIDTKRYKEDQRFHDTDYDAMIARRDELLASYWSVRVEATNFFGDWYESSTHYNPKRAHV